MVGYLLYFPILAFSVFLPFTGVRKEGGGRLSRGKSGRQDDACIIYYTNTLLWLESRSCEAAEAVLLNELIMLVNLEHYVPGIIQVP